MAPYKNPSGKAVVRAGRGTSNVRGKPRHPDVTEVKAKVEKAHKQRKVRPLSKESYMTFVFVGNLPPNTTREQLEKLFLRVGLITRVQIRCTAGLAYRSSLSETPSRHYATVEFKQYTSIPGAMSMNGSKFCGSKIVVTRNILELPEFQELIQEHLVKRRGSQPKLSVFQEKWNRVKQLTTQRTEKASIIPTRDSALSRAARQAAPPARHAVMGMSFSVTVA